MGAAKLLPIEQSAKSNLPLPPFPANHVGDGKETTFSSGPDTSPLTAPPVATTVSSANNLACASCAMRSLGICGSAVSPLRLLGPSGSIPPKLANSARWIPARKTILHPVECPDSVTIICEGIAQSMISTTNGRRQILSILLPGDVVSLLDLFTPRIGYTTEAVSDVTYRQFSRQKIQEYAFNYRTVMDTLMEAISNENVRINNLLLDLGSRTSEERIANFILTLHLRMQATGRVRNNGFEFPFRLHHIAETLGLSAVYAGKALSKLERAGLIEIKQRELKLLDIKRLRELAGATSIRINKR